MECLKAVEFFDLSQDLFCVIGTDGHLKMANAAFQQSVGYNSTELLSDHLSAFMHPSDLPGFIQYCELCISGSKADTNVSRFKCSDGSYKWFRWSGFKHADEPYIYTSVRDISSDKNVEEQLNTALVFNQRILDSSLDLICAIDTEGRFVSVSKASVTLLGYAPEEMVNRPCSDFLHPEDLDLTLKMTDDLKEGLEITNFQNRYLHKSGRMVPVVWSAKFSAADSLFYCIARNAVERKKQEQQIAYNERRFSGLIQAGYDVIAIIGLNGVCQYTSPTVARVLGYSPEYLMGTNIFDLIDVEFRPIVDTAIKKVTQQYQVSLPPFKIKSLSGEWRWVKAMATNLISEEAIGGIVINFRDTTDQILIEEQKEKAIRRLNKLIENYTQGYFSLDKNWIIKDVNPETLKLLRMSRDMLINRSILDLFHNQHSDFSAHYQLAIRENRFVEFEDKIASGNRWFKIAAYPYEDGLTIFFKEITNEKIQQLVVNLEKEVLEFTIRSETALQDTVNYYLQGLTNIYNFKCFLSLYNKTKGLLIPFSAPGLPPEYLNMLADGFAVSTEMGSCGAAAFTQECYVVGDISIHQGYESVKDMLLRNELLSCWSLPLISAEGALLGTLAVYHDSIKVPDDYEREMIKRVGVLLQILIESHQVKERLLISNERYRYITLATNDATYDWDIAEGSLYWGEGIGKLFGYTQYKTQLSDWAGRVHPAERDSVNQSLETALADPEVSYWHSEYRYQRADKSFAFVIDDGYILRDEHKQPFRMVGALKDITILKENANQIIKQNKRLQEIAKINSHHIRKPLANVLGIIETLKYVDGENLEELLAMLEESGTELDKIVRRIAKKTLV